LKSGWFEKSKKNDGEGQKPVCKSPGQRVAARHPVIFTIYIKTFMRARVYKKERNIGYFYNVRFSQKFLNLPEK